MVDQAEPNTLIDMQMEALGLSRRDFLDELPQFLRMEKLSMKTLQKDVCEQCIQAKFFNTSPSQEQRSWVERGTYTESKSVSRPATGYGIGSDEGSGDGEETQRSSGRGAVGHSLIS